MATETLKVDTSELKNIANTLATDSNSISSFYADTLSPILVQSEEALKVSGLDYASVETSFKTLFTNLGDQLSSFVTVLNNTIIPNYETLSECIAKAFNSDFKSQMDSIISQIK